MKKVIVLFGLILLGLNAYSLAAKDFLQTLSNKNKVAIGKSDKMNMLKGLCGDTITFDFGDTPYVDFFFTETPDTVWIKERPKKNPQEGKHFELTYAYKNVKGRHKYVTPTSELNGKQFAVLSVEDRSSKSLYIADVKLTLKLVDLEDLSIVDCNIPENLGNKFEIHVPRIDREINSLEGGTYYINASNSYRPEYRKVRFTDGNYKISFNHDITPSYNAVATINFVTDDGTIIPYKNHSTYSSRQNDYLITEEDYLDNHTVRQIDSQIDPDILNKNLSTPFNFSFILGVPTGTFDYISQTIFPQKLDSYSATNWTSSYLHAPKGVLLIGGSLIVKGIKFFKAIYNNKAFFIKAENVELDEKNAQRLDSLEAASDEIKDYFFQNSLMLSKTAYKQEIDEAVAKIKSFKQYGLAIYSYGVYDMSEYTDGTGFRIRFFNPTQQMIKYVSITFQGYNPVDDPVGRPLTKRCIGPIDPDDTATYDFEYAWFTDIVEYAKIRSITVTYKNGTTKTITNIKNILIPDDVKKILFGSNPLQLN